MNQKMMESFDELIKLSTKFVSQQGGKWDHAAWLEFLSDIQKMGYNLTHDMQSYLGSMLESMKKLYSTSTSTTGFENIILGIANNTVDFIKKTSGTWDHQGWEAYLKDLQKKGVKLSEETTTYLGGILEAAKELYLFPIQHGKDSKK
ncbi:MAG: hypothetical protein SFH39_18845 [Candidatus Magnetobacterium sp. LHC-1]|nr:hypothetical protein [Nitrospirota bacterium]